MAIRTERRSTLCSECGAAALTEHVEVTDGDKVERVERYTTCHNVNCPTRPAA